MGYLDKLKAAAALAKAAMEESQALSAASDPTAHLALRGQAGMVSYGHQKAPEGPDRIEDSEHSEHVRRTEHATRNARRADYLAASRFPWRITRFVTHGKDQTRDVAAHLAGTGLGARPDLMYGLYRVPDRISPSAGKEHGNVVEWDFVHAATEPLASSSPPADVFFAAERPWVPRRPGEPRVLDEDLALAFLLRAGIGPEQTLGIVRHVEINLEHLGSGEENEYMRARVQGVHALHPGGLGTTVTQEIDSRGRVEVPLDPPTGIWLEVLQWEPIARVVHPLRQHRPLLPSPFPYLPLTPQELLQAYVEIVGIAPSDSYGVQVTYSQPFDLLGRTSAAKFVTVRKTTGGDQLPCADGQHRPRLHGGQHIVVAYRDGTGYAEGRERWSAYEREVLGSNLALAHGSALRPPVPKPDSGLVRTFNRIGGVMDFVTGEMGAEETFVPPRYCWPPIG